MAKTTNRTCLARLPGGELQVLGPKDLHKIDVMRSKPEHLVWLDITSPNADDLALLRDEFSVHPLALEDLEKRRQRAKLDTYAEQQMLVTYEVLEPTQKDHSYELGELHLFAGTGYIVSVRWEASPTIEEVGRRFRERPDAVARTPGTLLYTILDAAVDGYFPLLDRISERIEELEDQILAAKQTGAATLRPILDMKRELLELRRTLSPQRDVANALLRRDLPLVDDLSAPYFQDLYDHLIRVLDQLDLQRDLLASALEANLSVTSNNLNAVMKRLTAFTVILMVPTLIAGIYGMNFHFMPELSSQLGYPIALGVMAVSMVGAAVFFKRKDWF
ncbi:MAG TPA: magnesium/cobalt transporter CorA [Methylomirabilota bacterium]|jgi:magnesium transporter|nr:magnesium/cobalt transporter CorA [Methylomirabilota bacterium]